jgi:hypothetical protein
MSYLTVRWLLLVVAALSISGCGIFGKKATDSNPLCVSECPDNLGELKDDSFGSTTSKLSEVIGIYRACKKACQTGLKKE